jgi:hypothetical protein
MAGLGLLMGWKEKKAKLGCCGWAAPGKKREKGHGKVIGQVRV